jgi:hypothetical protein
MNKYSNPLDYLISCCEQSLTDRKLQLDQFTINNAKDELKKLRDSMKAAEQYWANAKSFAISETKRWLSCESDRCSIQEKHRELSKNLQNPVAWGKVNSQGDLYDLRVQDNPYIPEEMIVPLYSDIVQFKDFYQKYRKNNDNNS